MAAARLDPKLLLCSLCLNLLKDPVTTSFGHSDCRKCLQQDWDAGEQRRVNRCPQCRRTFAGEEHHHSRLTSAFNIQDTQAKSSRRTSATVMMRCVIKMFCRIDQQIISHLCTMGKDKGHGTVEAAAVRTEEKKELEKIRQEIQQEIQHMREDLKVPHKEVKSNDQLISQLRFISTYNNINLLAILCTLYS